MELYRLKGVRYVAPKLLGRDETLEPPQLRGLSLSVDEILGPAEA